MESTDHIGRIMREAEELGMLYIIPIGFDDAAHLSMRCDELPTGHGQAGRDVKEPNR